MGQGTSEVNDPEVERLVEDIEETREEMTGTVEEIGDRLDPKNIVNNAKQSVKAATVGKVEDMAGTMEEKATEATEAVRDVGGSVIDTITRNPVPAAMVGLGIGWLVMSGRSQNGSQQANVGDPLKAAKRQAKGIASDAQQTVEQVKGEVGRLADEVPYQVRSTAEDLGTTASDMYRSNPLAIGAIAVAVGTAVGLALPATSFERRTVGAPAADALSKAGEVATEALGQVEDQARDFEQQAREEDTPARPH